MEIVGCAIPEKSLVQKYIPANYWDAYKCAISSDYRITADDLQIAFWTDQQPQWLTKLFKIRDSIVKWFGLQTDKGDRKKLEQCIKNGGTYNIFTVTDKSENETVLLLSDKHLNAHMSVYIEENQSGTKNIYVITIVHIHNLLGYL